MNFAPAGLHFLETSVVLAMMRQGATATSEAQIPFATLGKLMTGVHRAGNPAKESARMRRAIEACRVVYPTARTLAVYGQISAKLQQIGQPIPIDDLWNATLALEWNLPLLAADMHFDRVPGLKVIQIR